MKAVSESLSPYTAVSQVRATFHTVRLYLLTFLLLIGSLDASAQKVAVVLSGGGAKGIAHVGVLRALEEHNIPIDYIVGTSMGGIVGSLYAAGYSPAEIEYLVNTEAFQLWAAGKPEQNYLYNFAAPDTNPSLLKLHVAIDSTLQARLTSNIVNDASLNFALAQLMAQPAARANYNFDKLMVPFRCVAADIYTQQQVILREGQLADAVRATLTVPLFFRAIRINRRLLYDGGLYNNFPVDVAQREFDPDIIIGVNVSSKVYKEYPYGEDEFDLAHTLMYAMMSNSDSSALGKNGIYLQPDIGNLTSLDFKNVEELFTAGYDEAMKKMELIRQRIQRRSSPEGLTRKREQFRNGFKNLAFEDIEIRGLAKENEKSYVRKFFRKENTDYSIQEVKTGYFRLASANNFRNLYPTFQYNAATQKYKLLLDLQKEEDLKLSVGGVLASRPIDNIFAGLEYNLLGRRLYTLSASFNTGRFYQAANVRTRVDVPARHPFYLEPAFTYNNWNYLSTTGFLLERNKLPFIEQTDRSYALNLGITNSYKDKLVLSTAFAQTIDRYSNRFTIVNTDTLDKTYFNAFTSALTFRRGNLNRKQYASAGREFSSSVRYINGTEKYEPGSTAFSQRKTMQEHEWLRLKLSYERYIGEGAHRFGYLLEGVVSSQPFFQNYRASVIAAPAFTPLSDSKTLFLDNFRSHQYAAGGLRYIYLLSNRFEVRTEGYVFQPYKPLQQDADQRPYYGSTFTGTGLIGNASVVYHSLLGPVALNLNYYSDDSKRWGVLFHLGYLLFQDRALD